MALGEFAFDQLLAVFRGGGAGFLGFDAKEQGIARTGQQAPHQQGMQEVQIEKQGLRHRLSVRWQRRYWVASSRG